MGKSASIRGLGILSKWQAGSKWQLGLCLLLAALVIYNPYLAAPDSGAGLCVRHSASHRATVGASELQHFEPVDSRSLLPAAAIAIVQQFALLPDLGSAAQERAPEKAFPAVHTLPASLWFRPPPPVK